jgi:hypothetical protein
VFHRFLTTALILVIALSKAVYAQAPTTGVLQGHLNIISLETAKPADGTVPTVTPQTYLEYPLAVLTADGKQQIATITADTQGNFRADLPSGSYLLDIENRVRKHVRAKPVPFTVTANQTVHVNMEMDTGVR